MVAKSKSTPTSTKVTTATPTIQKSTEADIKSVPLSNPAIPFENIETIDSHSNRRIITETQKINSKLTKNIISTKNPLTKSTETIVSASKGNLKNIAADLASKSIKCDKPPCKESKEVKMEKVNDVIIAHSSKQTSGETVANNNSTDKVMIPPAENSNYTLATDSGTTIEMVASKADGLVGPRQDTTQYINQTRHSATETVETGLKSNFTVQYTEVAVNGSVQISDKNLTKKPVPLNSSDVIQRENLIWEDKNSNRSATNGTQVQNLKKNATVSTNATAVKTNAEKTKFNYASFDCGAVVMASNEEAKHVTSILSNAKDAYMLNPCSAEKFVEIELCQDILITSIRLANFEYFSSMLKNFEIFGSSKYPPTWISLGAFTAENSRSRQEFLLNDPTVWTKFIRIEFKTHYGSQYYCPITSVQVFGTSMIEEAKVYQETTAAVDPLPIQVEKPPARTSAVKEANIPALKAILDYDRMCHISRPPDSAVQNDSKPAQKESSIFGNILKRLGILEQLQSTLIQDFKVLKTEMHEFRDTHDVAMTNVEKQTQKTISKLVETIDKDFKKAMQDLEHRKALVESRLLDVAVVVESLQAQLSWAQFWNQLLFLLLIIAGKLINDRIGFKRLFYTVREKPAIRHEETAFFRFSISNKKRKRQE